MELHTSCQTTYLDQVSQQIQALFDDETLNQLARKTQFIERKRSDLSGRMFLILNAIQLTIDPNASLQQQCLFLEDAFQVKLKKQSLDERYNTFSVRFMKACFDQAFTHYLSKAIPQELPTAFSRILLRDSTTCQLPPAIAQIYPSKDTSKTGASLKLDYCFNYLDGKPLQLVLEAGRLPDSQIATQYQPDYQPNDLIIADLGYWNGGLFKTFHDQQTYFLSRLKTGVSLYEPVGETGGFSRVEVGDYLPEDDHLVSYNWYLGAAKTPVRVCIQAVPPWVKAQRLTKLTALSKSQQWALSEWRVRLCGYNLYVTNASSEQLPDALIGRLYGVRWQVELLFKVWKSVFSLACVKPMSVFRFECMLYGRLLVLLLNTHLQSVFKAQLGSDSGFELSEYKAADLLKKS